MRITHYFICFTLLLLISLKSLADTGSGNIDNLNTINANPSLNETVINTLNDFYHWGIAGYYTVYTKAIFVHDLWFDYNGFKNAQTGGATLTYSFDQSTGIGRAFDHIAAIPEIASNLAYINDATNPNEVQNLGEIDLYFDIRWRKFPWDHYLLTSIAVGMGPSYVTEVPNNEIQQFNNPANARRFLNYLMLEISFALPEHPQFEIFYRVNHRSGIFGLLCPEKVDSSSIGGGFRYRF